MKHSDQEKYMRIALREARRAFVDGEVPAGCVIVYGNRVVSKAHNKRQSAQSPLAHAEVLAIEKAAKKKKNWRLNDCTLVVTIEPCPMCMGAILHARIAEIVFAIREPKMGSLGSRVFLPKYYTVFRTPRFCEGVLADEARSLMQQFFKKLRKR